MRSTPISNNDFHNSLNAIQFAINVFLIVILACLGLIARGWYDDRKAYWDKIQKLETENSRLRVENGVYNEILKDIVEEYKRKAP